MTISSNLEEKLMTAGKDGSMGRVVVDTLHASVSDLSTYLSCEKTRHCSLSEQCKVIIGHANSKLVRKLVKSYCDNIFIDDGLYSPINYNVLRKLDLSISFDSVPLRGNGYDVKNAEILGSIRHTSSFNGSKYGISVDKSPVSTLPHGFTFEKLFYLILDPEVSYIRASRKLKPKKR